MGEHGSDYGVYDGKATDEPRNDVVVSVSEYGLERLADGGVLQLDNGDTITLSGLDRDGDAPEADWYIRESYITMIRDGYYVNLSGTGIEDISLVMDDSHGVTLDEREQAVFELFKESDDGVVRQAANEILQARGYSVEKDVEYRLEEP